jgi:hypothetical protein
LGNVSWGNLCGWHAVDYGRLSNGMAQAQTNRSVVKEISLPRAQKISRGDAVGGGLLGRPGRGRVGSVAQYDRALCAEGESGKAGKSCDPSLGEPLVNVTANASAHMIALH